ncbi:hypothetical protein NECAME_01740 [Necator americanus]|uniref:Uncharacterized protein n=1 Tax=Necator americanus TaxID=51031 RepID=W2TSF3_NECAM|nr:hypothetical protein NECAME_01740 [Necator americanus]ETN83947.1 hypothetical protein NECAME_01740 [Necator americanus]
MEAIRQSIFTITASMHHELNGSKGISPYMQELLGYIGRVEFHFSHFPSTIRRNSALPSISDYIIQLFIVNATLVRPLRSFPIAFRLATVTLSAAYRLLVEVHSKLSPSLKFPNRTHLLSLFSHEESSVACSMGDDSLPAWIYIHALICDSPDTLISPHVSVQWPIEQYVKWCCENSDLEIISFLNGLMTSYTTQVINRHETEYVPHYPRIMELIKKAAE